MIRIRGSYQRVGGPVLRGWCLFSVLDSFGSCRSCGIIGERGKARRFLSWRCLWWARERGILERRVGRMAFSARLRTVKRTRNRCIPRDSCMLLVGSIGDGHVFQLLDDWAHYICMRRWSHWFIHQGDLLRGQNPSDPAHEFQGILLRPKIYIKRVKLVHVFIFISGVEGRQVPVLCVRRC